MTVSVTFGLGPVGVSTVRTLTIRPIPEAGDPIPMDPVYGPTNEGAVAEATAANLPENRILQATLVDEQVGGEVSRTAVLTFHTGSLQYPGPSGGDRLSILSMEEESSSSSSSSS